MLSHVKRRGGLLVTPALVAYLEVEQNGSPTDLFLLALDFLVNPLDCGRLRQLRSRTWGSLKSLGVKLLLVNHAELLSFNAFYELVRITEKLEISVVLAGSPYLPDAIDAKDNRKKKYVPIYNTFYLDQHPYSTLSEGDVKAVVEKWESQLSWSGSLNLTSDDIVKVLHSASQGQLKVLYENLRKVAIWKLDSPEAEVNPQNVSKALKSRKEPISKP